MDIYLPIANMSVNALLIVALGVPAGTVRSRLHHAMRGLRAALDADARPTPQEVAR